MKMTTVEEIRMKAVGNLTRNRPHHSFQLAVTAFFVLLLAHPAAPQTLTNFRIANGTSGENPAVLWVGVEQGFYRKHGLNVEVIYMRVGCRDHRGAVPTPRRGLHGST